MTNCEGLFDKNVLPIKKLARDIGDVSKLIHKKKRNFFCMMIVTLLLIHFLQKSIKKIQSYGLISLEDDLNYKNIINSKNKLKLNIINDIQKEFIMLPLEDILNPKKLKQSIKNNKIFNLIN